MLAYIAWHRPAAGVDVGAYEQALQRFHHSLARVPPSGFEGSQAFRAGGAPPQIGSAAAADEEAIQALQSRAFFSRYTEQTKRVAGGEVEVLPLETIAETKHRA